MEKTRQKKIPVATGRVCNFVQLRVVRIKFVDEELLLWSRCIHVVQTHALAAVFSAVPGQPACSFKAAASSHVNTGSCAGRRPPSTPQLGGGRGPAASAATCIYVAASRCFEAAGRLAGHSRKDSCQGMRLHYMYASAPQQQFLIHKLDAYHTQLHKVTNSTCRDRYFFLTRFFHNRPKNDAPDLKKWSRKTRPAFLYNL